MLPSLEPCFPAVIVNSSSNKGAPGNSSKSIGLNEVSPIVAPSSAVVGLYSSCGGT